MTVGKGAGTWDLVESPVTNIAISVRPAVAEARAKRNDRHLIELVFKCADHNIVIELPRNHAEDLMTDMRVLLDQEEDERKVREQMMLFHRMGEPL